jgi:repressor LexA
VLEFIERSIDQRGYPPTLREIAGDLGVSSTNGVNDHLKALERKGYLRREDLKSRALRPVAPRAATRRADELVSVPLLGRVAAGEPLLAVENVEDNLSLDRLLVGRDDDLFGLRVQGESMVEDGIRDGDIVFVRRQQAARSGEVVVAMIEGEATVKRYFPEGDRIRFQPANAAMAPIVVNRTERRTVELLGVVVGLYRRL